MIGWKSVNELLGHTILPPSTNFTKVQSETSLSLSTKCVGHMVTEWSMDIWYSKLHTMFRILSESQDNVSKGKNVYSLR